MALTQVDQSMIVQPVVTYGPAFAVYLNTTQTVSSGVAAKVSLDTELFDTNNCWNTTLFRFTPTTAGYYEFTGRLLTNAATTNSTSVALIYKNGALLHSGPIAYGGGTNNLSCSVSALVYLNGSTDYVEFWGTDSGSGANTFVPGSANTFFMGFLARPA